MLELDAYDKRNCMKYFFDIFNYLNKIQIEEYKKYNYEEIDYKFSNFIINYNGYLSLKQQNLDFWLQIKNKYFVDKLQFDFDCNIINYNSKCLVDFLSYKKNPIIYKLVKIIFNSLYIIKQLFPNIVIKSDILDLNLENEMNFDIDKYLNLNVGIDEMDVDYYSTIILLKDEIEYLKDLNNSYN